MANVLKAEEDITHSYGQLWRLGAYSWGQDAAVASNRPLVDCFHVSVKFCRMSPRLRSLPRLSLFRGHNDVVVNRQLPRRRARKCAKSRLGLYSPTESFTCCVVPACMTLVSAVRGRCRADVRASCAAVSRTTQIFRQRHAAVCHAIYLGPNLLRTALTFWEQTTWILCRLIFPTACRGRR